MHDRVTQIYARPQLSPRQVASFIAALGCVVNSCIEALDLLAGDPDLELNGDEADGTGGEDDFCDHANHHGPGCPIADSDIEHDGREVEHEL